MLKFEAYPRNAAFVVATASVPVVLSKLCADFLTQSGQLDNEINVLEKELRETVKKWRTRILSVVVEDQNKQAESLEISKS